MSIDHVIQLIKDHYSTVDLVEKLGDTLTTEDLLYALEDVIKENFEELFEEELEQYYNTGESSYE